MRPKLPWFKWPTDPHWPPVAVLTIAELGLWARLSALASASPQRGILLLDEGVPHSRETLIQTLRLQGSDIKLMDSLLEKMHSIGYLSSNGNSGQIEMPHWEAEQAPAPSTTPEHVKERVARHRARKREEDPEKYTKGRMGHLVKRRLDDAEE